VNQLTKLLALCAVAAVSLTQGCSCSDKKSGGTVTPVDPVPVTKVSLDGTALKGLIKNATVTAYGLKNGAPDLTAPLGTGTTNSAGVYTLQVPNSYEGKPLFVRVTPAADGSTKIKCDIATGCGPGVAFGADYSLPANAAFDLDVLIPSLDKSKKIHVSTLSDLAFETVKGQLATITDSTKWAEAIREANSKLANRFGILGDLLDLEPVDLTDKEAVKALIASGKTDSLRFVALNAAIVQAAMADNSGKSLAEAMVKFALDFVARGLAGNTSDDSLTDFAEILDALNSILNAVSALDPANIKLDTLIAQIIADKKLAEQEVPDRFDSGTALPVDNSSDAEKTKAMVNLLRELLRGEDIILSTKIGSSTLGAEKDRFRLQLDAAEMASSKDMAVLGNGVAKAAEAIVKAYDAFQDNSSLKSYAYGDYTVSITAADNKVTYAVKQTASVYAKGMAVSVDMDIKGIDDFTVTEENTTTTAKGGLWMMGSAKTAALSMTIKEGSNLRVTTLTGTEGTTDSVEASSLKLSLMVDLAQVASQTITSPITASGRLSGNFASLKGSSSDSAENAETGLMDLALGATVKNTSGDTANVSFAIIGDAKGAKFSDIWESGVRNVSEESATNYVGLTMAANFDAVLSNTAAAEFSLTASRTTQTTTNLVSRIKFGANLLRISALVQNDGDGDMTLEIKNQNNFVLSLAQATTNGKETITGSIKRASDGKLLADVTDTNLGIKVTIKELTTDNVVYLTDAPE
jgi:trimeric autotransporter adhesin